MDTVADGRGHRPVQVLLASPDPHADRVLDAALGSFPGSVSGSVFESGVEAAKAVPSVGEELFDRVPFVLVDVALGADETREMVEGIKSDPSRCRAPVIVLDSAEASGESLYDAFANAIVPWPEGEDEKIEQLKALLAFWLKIPALP